MSERLSLSAAALTLAGCAEPIVPHAADCLAAFQQSEKPAEPAYHVTSVEVAPVLVGAEDAAEITGFVVPMTLGSNVSATTPVDVEEEVGEGHLMGVAYPGNDPYSPSPLTAHPVYLDTRNPNPYDPNNNPEGWANLDQALYAAVDMTDGEPSHSWVSDGPETVGITLLTEACTRAVLTVVGTNALVVEASPEGVENAY